MFLGGLCSFFYLEHFVSESDGYEWGLWGFEKGWFNLRMETDEAISLTTIFFFPPFLLSSFLEYRGCKVVVEGVVSDCIMLLKELTIFRDYNITRERAIKIFHPGYNRLSSTP